ncbi:MAG: glycosyltransferase family 4 protein [Bacteroidales bacterium]|nr:glycosyltransferase family 4 protein [Bacteroidales bacterium]
MQKIAIISTHPIQYNAPWFRLLNSRKKVEVKVFYTWQNAQNKYYDAKFKQEISWDIPLLESYEYEFVRNIAKVQSSQSYFGIQNPDLNKKIEVWGANAILVFGWKFKSHLGAMRYFKGKIPVYFRGDSTLIDEQNFIKDKLRRFVLKQVYKKIDFALFVGQQNKAYFQAHGIKDAQLIFTPHAIDNQRFFNNNLDDSNKANEWRKALDISDKDVVFLFVGKFESKKNPEILIRAAAKIKNPFLKLIFVGNGHLEIKLNEMAKKYDFIRFVPFQNQSKMPIVYRLGDVFVLPSVGPGETWGLGVNEAMSCGLAIIVSDKVGCAIDLVSENENGFIFNAGNIDDLAKKMKIMLNNEQKRKEFALNSIEKIKKWNFSEVCESIENSLLYL